MMRLAEIFMGEMRHGVILVVRPEFRKSALMPVCHESVG